MFASALLILAQVSTPQCGQTPSTPTTSPGPSAPSTGSTPTIPTSNAANVLPISVNAGPTNDALNQPFATVTICVPGTSNCQTIGGILIDTGSMGLRIISSALTLPLPQQTGAGGAPVVECLPFVSGVTWGPVQTADIRIAGEQANSAAI